MPRGSKLTDEERIAAVQEYLDGKAGYETIAKKYNIGFTTMRIMIARAKSEGIDALRTANPNRKYSKETKESAVKDYLSGKGSLLEICSKYKISSDRLLRNWIMCYNSGKDFKEQGCSERGITMSKGRKTAQEERVEIVAFCLENGKNYQLTMEKYNVSYDQIYSWVHKYELNGVNGLIDRRGKRKSEDQITETERLQMENKILQAKIKDMEMENNLLKKLRELQGGGH